VAPGNFEKAGPHHNERGACNAPVTPGDDGRVVSTMSQKICVGKESNGAGEVRISGRDIQ
jgi:hypothetical protein